MIDEEKTEIEDKIENAMIKLRGIAKEDQISFEKGKILFYIGIPIYPLIIFVFGFFFIGFVKLNYYPLIAGFLGIVFIFLGIILLDSSKIYNVIDYEKKMVYYEKRDRNNKIYSKEILIKTNEVLAVGVNNHIGQGTKHDPGDIVTGEREESGVALLKANGELFSLNGFKSKHYPNDCLIAEAISILLNIPIIKCYKEQQLKVIKTVEGYKLVTEPLKRDSLTVNILKQAMGPILFFGFVFLVLLILAYFGVGQK